MACKNCGNRGTSTPYGAMKAAKIQTPETTEVRSWTELPLLDLADVPKDLDILGGSDSRYQAWRIPAEYFLGGGSLNHSSYTVVANGSDVKIPTGQVVPIYIANSLAPVTAAEASNASKVATDLAVALDNDGNYILMKNGYYKFPRQHQYEIGKTYYLSQCAAGEVISERPTAGIIQPLFTVVDQTTISINVALY